MREEKETCGWRRKRRTKLQREKLSCVAASYIDVNGGMN
jgi:hypothetical protein